MSGSCVERGVVVVEREEWRWWREENGKVGD